jgi:hypothetical protein
MAMPAARLTEMHVRPLVTVLVLRGTARQDRDGTSDGFDRRTDGSADAGSNGSWRRDRHCLADGSYWTVTREMEADL